MTSLLIEQTELSELTQYPAKPAISQGEFVVAVPVEGNTFAECGISGSIYSIVKKKLCGGCSSRNACKLTQGGSGGGRMRFHFQITPWDDGEHIPSNQMSCQTSKSFSV